MYYLNNERTTTTILQLIDLLGAGKKNLSFHTDARRVAVRVPDHGERVHVRRHRLRTHGIGREAGLVQDRGRGCRVSSKMVFYKKQQIYNS